MTFDYKNATSKEAKLIFLLIKILSQKEAIELTDMLLDETSTIRDIENKLIDFDNEEPFSFTKTARNTEGV